MPLRGGSVGGSRGSFRAPRLSSGDASVSRGFQILIGNHTPRLDTTSSALTHYKPIMRPRISLPWGPVWKIVAILLGLLAFGACASVGLGFVLQAQGY